jgi:hypothetical protein
VPHVNPLAKPMNAAIIDKKNKKIKVPDLSISAGAGIILI